jgi:hypothetical protein
MFIWVMLSNICMLCSQTISLLLLCFHDAFVRADAVLKGMHRPKTDNLESIAGAGVMLRKPVADSCKWQLQTVWYLSYLRQVYFQTRSIQLRSDNCYIMCFLPTIDSMLWHRSIVLYLYIVLPCGCNQCSEDYPLSHLSLNYFLSF